MEINSEDVQNMWQQMSGIGATRGGGVTRLALTDADRAARDLLREWMADAGLEVRVDDLGNVIGRRAGCDPDKPVVLVGSHLDSVRNGGRYDGAIGVLAALEVVRTLTRHGVATRSDIEVIDFTNEEGARFEPAIMSSGVLAGQFTREYYYSRTDPEGVTLGAELQRIGYAGDPAARPQHVGTFLELHVEQGPVLETEGLPVGAVEGILGLVWLEVELTGQASHAGPTPMARRQDALVAAADLIARIRGLAGELGDESVTTVGRLRVEPDIINVIPGRVVFSVDIRHPRGDVVDAGAERLRNMVAEVARVHGVRGRVQHIWTMPPTRFDPDIVQAVEDAARTRGYGVRRITAGAGHDAKYMSAVAPTGMVFVPSRGGKSHCEEEYTDWADIVRGANVLLDLVCRYAGVV